MRRRTPALRCARTMPGWAKVAEHQAGRFADAKQYGRMQRKFRKLRTMLGCVIRDVQRKGGEFASALKAKLEIA